MNLGADDYLTKLVAKADLLAAIHSRLERAVQRAVPEFKPNFHSSVPLEEVGMIQTVAFAAEEPAWSLEGRSIIADICGVDCHCLIGGPPDNGLCQFFLIAQINNGQYAGVNLEDVLQVCSRGEGLGR
jgi:uncharacterized protein DUF1326